MATTDNQNKNHQKSNNHQKELNQLKEYLKYSGLAFQMIAIILLGLWIGMKLDEWVSTGTPIFTVLGVLIAIVASLISIIKNLPKS